MRLLPGRIVPAFVNFVVIDKVLIGALGPTPRGFIVLAWKDAHGRRNGDVEGVVKAVVIFPIEPSRRYSRVRQPVEGDVVKHVISCKIAAAAKLDALEFRRRLLGNQPKARAVLEAVAERGGWGKPLENGVMGRGLALFRSFGNYAAALAEVSVDGAKLKMHRIVGATDSGYAVNPRQIEMQVEGSFVYGLGALFQEITIKDGKSEQSNFDSYRPMLLAAMPKVETIVMPSGGWWGGVGEPMIAVAAPAVLNAVANATGKRIRQLPIKDQSIRA